MARMHGQQCRVYLGGRDASADIVTVSVAPKAAVHDRTTFADGGPGASGCWRQFDPGLLSWDGGFTGFYDAAAGGIGRQLETALGADTAGLAVLSVYDGDADAVGETGILGSEAIVTQRTQPISVADLIRLNATLKGNGRLGLNGKLLHPLAQETVTASTTSLNNGAATAAGGRGVLHITAITGTWTIVIEQSSDNGAGDPWAALVSFTAATAIGAQTIEVTGAVEQYLRVTATETVAGSCTFVCGFARY